MGWFGNSYLSEDCREQERRGTHTVKSLRVTQVSLPPISVLHLPAFATILKANLAPVWSAKIPSHFAEGCLGASGPFSSGQRGSAAPSHLALPSGWDRRAAVTSWRYFWV